MINRLVFVFIFTLSLIVAQSDLQNGIRYYNQRHERCVEDRADPKPISQAISHFEKALADQKKAKFNQAEGDHLTLLAVYNSWKHNKFSIIRIQHFRFRHKFSM